jgi:peptidoglycan/xylan/chitin deacetylase (PgdA/CDA1 family)
VFEKLTSAPNVVPAPDAITVKFITLLISVLCIFAKQEAHAKTILSHAKLLTQKVEAASHLAKSHQEWHAIEKNIAELKSTLFNAPDITMSERCNSLSQLNDEQLTLYYDEIFFERPEKIKFCQENLGQRISTFYKVRTLALAKSYKKISQDNLTQCSDNKSLTFGPGEAYTLSDRDRSILFGKSHPECVLTITIDDGPHPTLTPRLLDIFDKESLLVNFFLVGRRVAASPDIVEDEYSRGHVIGNHSLSHKNLPKETYEEGVIEIESGFEKIFDAINAYVPFFRFPYGAYTAELRAYNKELGRTEFYWNIDTEDWKIRDPEKLFKNVMQVIEAERRGIVLFHDVHPQTIAVMPFVLESLREAGYSARLILPAEQK